VPTGISLDDWPVDDENFLTSSENGTVHSFVLGCFLTTL
jgi:hypothetical protein